MGDSERLLIPNMIVYKPRDAEHMYVSSEHKIDGPATKIRCSEIVCFFLCTRRNKQTSEIRRIQKSKNCSKTVFSSVFESHLVKVRNEIDFLASKILVDQNCLAYIRNNQQSRPRVYLKSAQHHVSVV